MKHSDPIRQRRTLLRRLPVTDEILRGSLLERSIRPHRQGCAKCASGEGHPLWVLTVSYSTGRTRQVSLRVEQVDEVRRWLGNYRKLKDGIEELCELNQQLLRQQRDAAPPRGKQDD
jgi:hypothetical protein